MQHRGEIIRKAIDESGISITSIAHRMGKSRRWMYLLFDNPEVSLDVVLEIGKIIHRDFSADIKALQSLPQQLLEPNDNLYQTGIHTAEYWKNKYLDLLEQHMALLKKLGNNS